MPSTRGWRPTAEPQRYPRVSDPGQAVLDGQRVAFTDRGSGPTVLFLHGIGSSRHAFGRQLSALEAGFRCIAWDAPGYGDSADPSSPPGMDGYAEAAAGLLVQLGAAPAHVVGVSWGDRKSVV